MSCVLSTLRSLSSVFRDLFKELSGVMLGVYGTIWRVSWRCLGVILKVFGGALKGEIRGNWGHTDSLKQFCAAVPLA